MTAAVARRPLVDVIAEALEADDLRLPVYSAVAARVQTMASRTDVTAEKIEQVVLHDPALVSHILRVANSAFYAGLSSVDSIRTAILRLGLNRIVELSVLCTQKAQYRSADPAVQAIMERLWQHAMACAFGARWLAERGGYRDRAAEAFMGGLLHDIGKLLIIKIIEDLRLRGDPSADVPNSLVGELLDTLHTDQGGRLIECWNLAPGLARIARGHHDEDLDDADITMLLVRVADRVCARLGFSMHPDPELVPAALPEVAALGLSDVLIAEMEIVLEDGMKKLVG